MLEESNLGGIFVTLNDGTLGEPYRILAVDCEGALRRRLLDMGLTPKTIISIRKVAPMGDPLELTVRGYQLTLRKEDAARIKVEPVKGHSPGPGPTTGWPWPSWTPPWKGGEDPWSSR